MAKQTNPKLIGAFVIGAIALVIAGILAFGGSQYFTAKIKVVVFFPGASLSGLDVGSPVTFRGVKIGQVTSIVIRYDVARQKLRVPIRLELDSARMQFVSGEHNPGKDIPELIARGLRGQLQTVSLVTGQTTLDFNFYPDTPVRLRYEQQHTIIDRQGCYDVGRLDTRRKRRVWMRPVSTPDDAVGIRRDQRLG